MRFLLPFLSAFLLQLAAGVALVEPIAPDEGFVLDFLGVTSRAAEKAFSQHLANQHIIVYSPTDNATSISDGGNDMFDGGNTLSVYKAGDAPPSLPVVYGRTFRDPDRLFVGSSNTTQPFILAALVANPSQSVQTIFINEQSDLGADGDGTIANWSDQIYYGGFTVDYEVFQVYSANDPSVIQIFYVASNREVFNSAGTWDISLSIGSFSRQYTNNTASIKGNMTNVYVGYMLASKENGIFTPREELRDVIRNLLINVIQELTNGTGPMPATTDSPTPGTNLPPPTDHTYQPPTNFTLPPPGNATFTPPGDFTTSPMSAINSSLSTVTPPQNDSFIGSLLTALYKRSYAILTSYSDPYFYLYDGRGDDISDGGFDMYDSGNKVDFIDETRNYTNSVRVRYNNVINGSGYEAGAYTLYPFAAVMAIGNVARGNGFGIQVSGNAGADGSGDITLFNDTLSYGHLMMQYAVFQIHSTSDPVICEIYYSIQSYRWHSSGGEFVFNALSGSTNNPNNRLFFSGSPRNTILGFTLLSRPRGRRIESYEVRNVMREVIQAYINVDGPFPDFPVQDFTTPPTPTGTTPSFTTGAPPNGTAPTRRPVARSLLAFHAFSHLIRDLINNFFSYRYSPGSTSISDGGGDMYDGGNMVYYGSSFPIYSVTYGETYSFDDFSLGSFAGHPFITLMYVGDTGNAHNYSIEVRSNAGADNDGTVSRFNGTIRMDYTLHYEVFELYAARDPTIAEVYFTMTSFAWGSSPVRLHLDVTSEDQNRLLNRATMSSPSPVRNAFFGYMLLSEGNGQFIRASEIENALRTVGALISSYSFNDVVIPTAPPTTPGFNFTTPFTTAFTPTTPFPTFSPPPDTNDTAVGSVFNCLHYSSAAITRNITDFHYYAYDGYNSIGDGRRDMYDNGNMVFFSGPYSNRTQAIYNQTTYGNGFVAGTYAGHPFQALMWIERPGRRYSIQVNGNAGADGSGSVGTYNNTLYYYSYYAGYDITLEYKVVQIYGAGDPSICEVFYTVRSPGWQSSGGYSLQVAYNDNTDTLVHNATLYDYSSRVYLGYTLFSSLNGRYIPQHEVEAALHNYLHCFASVVPPSPTPTFTPTFTTPTGSPPPPVGDLDFLPSCRLREAIRRVWSCENAFTEKAPYSNPDQCRSNINTVVHCVANQLTQCASGNGPNVLRRYNIPLDIESIIHAIRYLAASSPSCYSYDPITSFCHKAPLPVYFGAPFSNMTDFFLCHPHATHGIIANLTQLYYAYVGARTAGEICVAYRKFRDGFVNTARYQCSLESVRYFLDSYHPELYNYVQQAAQVILDSVAVLEISSCPKISVNNSRTRINTEWLRVFVKWRTVTLPRWQAMYNRWIESLDSVYYPLPEVPSCREVPVSCRNPSQYTCLHEYSCRFCYCLDHKYNGLIQSVLEPWKEEFYRWQSFMEEWERAANSWEMNGGVL